MKFINSSNGIVIDMPDDWRGDNWEPVEKPAPSPQAAPKESAAKKTASAPKATPKAVEAKKPAEKKTKK